MSQIIFCENENSPHSINWSSYLTIIAKIFIFDFIVKVNKLKIRMGKIIVIAGATGNLGGKIVQALLAKEAEVRAIVRYSTDIKKIKKLEEKGVKIESSSVELIAKEEVEVSEKEKTQCQKLFDLLDDNDAVQNVYSNLKI